MSKFYDAARRAEGIRSGAISPDQDSKDARAAWQRKRDFQVVAVTSNKIVGRVFSMGGR